jgi:hypothetical protein
MERRVGSIGRESVNTSKTCSPMIVCEAGSAKVGEHDISRCHPSSLIAERICRPDDPTHIYGSHSYRFGIPRMLLYQLCEP